MMLDLPPMPPRARDAVLAHRTQLDEARTVIAELRATLSVLVDATATGATTAQRASARTTAIQRLTATLGKEQPSAEETSPLPTGVLFRQTEAARDLLALLNAAKLAYEGATMAEATRADLAMAIGRVQLKLARVGVGA